MDLTNQTATNTYPSTTPVNTPTVKYCACRLPCGWCRELNRQCPNPVYWGLPTAHTFADSRENSADTITTAYNSVSVSSTYADFAPQPSFVE